MKKKSGKKASEAFKKHVQEIEGFLNPKNLSSLSAAHVTWAYDYGVIRLYREFEDMILNCLVAAINNDTQQLSKTTGIDFPKHLRDEVCEFIIIGGGYFNFKGRDGLIRTLKKYLPATHYLVALVRKDAYKDALDRLSALRDFAAHDSRPAKKRALQATGGQKMASSGAWLKRQERFQQVALQLTKLAEEINKRAPY